jgi:hypothetical protein
MNQLVYKLSLRNGLLIGGISTLLTVVFYIINPVIQYTSFVVPILTLVIVIALLVILALDIRKKNGGYWTFAQAFLSLLIMSICMVIIGLIVNFIIIKLNPALPQMINDAAADATSQRLEKMGMDQSQIDDASKMFTNGEFIQKIQPTLFNEIKGLGLGVLIYAVIDLIIAACIRKTAPMFAAETISETIE